MAERSLTDAPERGWGEGWPRDRRADMGRAVGGVNDPKIGLNVQKAIVPLVEHLLTRTEQLGYDLDPRQCGGYVNRPMKRTDGSLSSTPSNHSWGLAVDLNWSRNGFGRNARHDLPDAVGDEWEALGFNWGGRWSKGSPDWMHFEYALTPTDAERAAALLFIAGLKGAPIPSTPVPPPPTRTLPQSATAAPPMIRVLRLTKPLMYGYDIGAVQTKLTGWAFITADSAVNPGTADSWYGPATEAAVRQFQRRAGLGVDGVVGSRTWTALFRI